MNRTDFMREKKIDEKVINITSTKILEESKNYYTQQNIALDDIIPNDAMSRVYEDQTTNIRTAINIPEDITRPIMINYRGNNYMVSSIEQTIGGPGSYQLILTARR